MMTGIYKVASGAQQEQDRQASIARNLAGSQLPGYRREFLHKTGFQAALHGGGQQQVETLTEHRAGHIRPTGRPLDFAVSGDAFFTCVDAENNQVLSRNGRFFLSPDRRLVTGEGLAVEGTRGPVQIPAMIDAEQLLLNQDGQLVATTPAGMLILDELSTVVPDDPGKLERISSNYYRAGTADLEPGDPREIMQRSLEQSNVSPLMEMATMIESMREFEAAHKMINMSNEILRKHNEL